jgi:DNA-directed RNA polymerase specialized sigma subunit
MTKTASTITADTIRDAQAGDSDAMWQVVSSMEGVLRGIVHSVASTASDDDRKDLMQEARVELISRIGAYETDASAALSTFVFAGVRRAVADAWLHSSTSLTANPERVYRVRRALAEAEGNVEMAWMLVSAPATRSGRKALSRETFMSIIAALQPCASLDEQADGDGVTLADTLVDPAGLDVDDPSARRALAHWLLRQLAPRQAYVLRAFYGIGMDRQEDAATADMLDIKPGSVRRLRNLAIKSAQRVAVSHSLIAQPLTPSSAVA